MCEYSTVTISVPSYLIDRSPLFAAHGWALKQGSRVVKLSLVFSFAQITSTTYRSICCLKTCTTTSTNLKFAITSRTNVFNRHNEFLAVRITYTNAMHFRRQHTINQTPLLRPLNSQCSDILFFYTRSFLFFPLSLRYKQLFASDHEQIGCKNCE